MGTRRPLRWTARSSTAWIAYSPRAEILMTVRLPPAPAGPSTLPDASFDFPALDDPGRVLGEVGDDDVGAGPPDGRESLHHLPRLVQPAQTAGRADHGVLPGDGVRGQGHPELALGARDDVQVRQGRLHHDDVGALVDVEGDLAHGLHPVGGIHLV